MGFGTSKIIMRFPNRRMGLALPFFLFLIIGLQSFSFLSLILTTGTDPGEDFDLVIAYSELTTMRPALDLALFRRKPIYISQGAWEANPFPHLPKADQALVHIDSSAATTDQNARHAAAFIRRGGYKKVALDVEWYHMPRALFLTRLYLMGSGVKVIPCVKTPLPAQWWEMRLFHIEFYKFWGSIFRVILAFLGWEGGPTGPHIWT
jgi:hypothetical protein